MLKIKFIHLSIMRNDEHFQFVSEFSDLVNQMSPGELGIEKLWDTFTVCFNNEDDALKKIVKSSDTEKIKEADETRDSTYRGIVYATKAALCNHDSNIKAAAKRIKIVLDTYGNLAVKPLNEETSGINNMLHDLKTKYADEIRITGLENWVNQLEVDNNALETLVKARGNEISSITQLKMKDARAETEKSYYTIIDVINALILINDENKYKTFVNNLNFFIDKYNNTIAQRAGRAKAKKDAASNVE
jgi:hypothetical protein